MQSTDYHILGSNDGTHWIEFTPLPRSKSAALKVFEELKGRYEWLRVERHVFARDVVKSQRGLKRELFQ